MNFSFVIPAHNEEKYIEETLKSIPKRAEIIVACNACSDSTAEIAKKYAKVISLPEPNVSVARNEGAKNSSGNVVIFLDADTKINSENFLQEIEKSLKNSIIGTTKSYPDSKSIRAKLAIGLKNSLVWVGWSSGIIFCTKEVFDKEQGFNETMTKKEDGDFIKRCKRHGKFKVANCSVVTSMRRYEKWGYLRLMFYWLKETLVRSKRPYPVVR